MKYLTTGAFFALIFLVSSLVLVSIASSQVLAASKPEQSTLIALLPSDVPVAGESGKMAEAQTDAEDIDQHELDSSNIEPVCSFGTFVPVISVPGTTTIQKGEQSSSVSAQISIQLVDTRAAFCPDRAIGEIMGVATGSAQPGVASGEDRLAAGLTNAENPTAESANSLTQPEIRVQVPRSEPLPIANVDQTVKIAQTKASRSNTTDDLPMPSVVPAEIEPSDKTPLYEKYGAQYGVDPVVMQRIASCESGERAEAVNGPYGGMFQFVSSTWSSNRKAMGEDPNPALRFNAEEAVKTAAFKMSRDGYGAWPVCGRKAIAQING